MKVLAAIVALLVVFSAVILWKTIEEGGKVSGSSAEQTPPLAACSGFASQTSGGAHPGAELVLETLTERRGPEGERHALLASPARTALYYQRRAEAPQLLDRGVTLGLAFDLAVAESGDAFAAYADLSSGEVRFAALAESPLRTTALARLERPGRIALSAGRDGVLVSYYDEETETLGYSYWDARDRSWREGVAHQGGTYRVVRGRPGAFELGD